MLRKLTSLAIAALFLGFSAQADAAAVKFDANNPVEIGAGLTAEPSGASGNGVIFVSTTAAAPSRASTRQRYFLTMPSDSAATRSSSTRLPSTASSGFCKAPGTGSPSPVRPILKTAMARRGRIGT
jgi:hypothetical protein